MSKKNKPSLAEFVAELRHLIAMKELAKESEYVALYKEAIENKQDAEQEAQSFIAKYAPKRIYPHPISRTRRAEPWTVLRVGCGV